MMKIYIIVSRWEYAYNLQFSVPLILNFVKQFFVAAQNAEQVNLIIANPHGAR